MSDYNQAKQLNLTQIKNDNKRYDRKERVFFDEGEFYVDVNLYFKPEKTQKMLEDLGNTLQMAEKEGLEIEDKYLSALVQFFIIKHFSSLPMTKRKNAKGVFSDFITLINSKYFKEIINGFLEEEISQVFEHVYSSFEAYGKLIEAQQKLQKQIQNLPLENRDILFPNVKQIPEA